MSLSWDDIKKKREPATAKVPICLSQRIIDELAALEDELLEARQEDRRHQGELSYQPKALEVAQRIKALEAEAAEHEVEFVFGEVPRAEWNVLLRRNAATKEQKAQGVTRFNPDTFPPAAIAASIIDPPLTREEAEELCSTWPEGQVTRLFTTVLELNMAERAIPRSPMASEVIREAVGKSGQHESGESHPASSQDG